MLASARAPSRREYGGSLREFCGSRSCFVVIIGDICNDAPMTVVLYLSDPKAN
jgi:hypothetical protein